MSDERRDGVFAGEMREQSRGAERARGGGEGDAGALIPRTGTRGD